MSAITLEQAERIIDAIIERGAALDCRLLSVIVVEPGCKVKAFKKEDGSSMIRFEMAYGKAYAALALGRSAFGIRAAGLKTDEDCAGMGRRVGLFRTAPPAARSSPRRRKPS